MAEVSPSSEIPDTEADLQQVPAKPKPKSWLRGKCAKITVGIGCAITALLGWNNHLSSQEEQDVIAIVAAAEGKPIDIASLEGKNLASFLNRELRLGKHVFSIRENPDDPSEYLLRFNGRMYRLDDSDLQSLFSTALRNNQTTRLISATVGKSAHSQEQVLTVRAPFTSVEVGLGELDRALEALSEKRDRFDNPPGKPYQPNLKVFLDPTGNIGDLQTAHLKLQEVGQR